MRTPYIVESGTMSPRAFKNWEVVIQFRLSQVRHLLSPAALLALESGSRSQEYLDELHTTFYKLWRDSFL